MPTPLPAQPKPIRLLILSAGSLLGQNILDTLEPRRRQINVIGADAQAENGRLFRCDRVYLVPPIAEEADFERRLLEIAAIEEPDLIVPGRDHDVLFLSRFKTRHPQWASRIPCGCCEAAQIMNDKALSSAFAQRLGLPFAETLLIGAATTWDDVALWLRRTRLPVVAKPRDGYGSLGVRVLFTEDHVRRMLASPGYVLQEYLGHPPDWEAIQRDFAAGVALFRSIPEEAQYAGQTVIAPAGALAESFCSINKMVMGRCERSQQVHDRAAFELTRAAAQAVAAIGWRGSFNVQFKRTVDGGFKIHEMNGRMTGSTSARRLMGYDEIRLLLAAFTGQDPGPVVTANDACATSVTRTLSDCLVPDHHVAALKKNRIWQKAS